MMKFYYFSGFGNTRTLAQALAAEWNGVPEEIPVAGVVCDQSAVLLFPVYCQSIPPAVSDFLRRSVFSSLYLVAMYGGFGTGNVLQEARNLLRGTVIGGALVPGPHTFLRESPAPLDPRLVTAIRECMAHPRAADFPKMSRNPFAKLAPALRSRLSVRIRKNHSCSGCGLCTAKCPMNTMRNGKPGNRCIRCLRCVGICPEHALEFHPRKVLRWYLSGKRESKLYLF